VYVTLIFGVRWFGLRNTLPILALAWLLSGTIGWTACHPPRDIAVELDARPNASVYARLGDWFAQHNQALCAAQAFSKAVAIEPGSGRYTYLLGLSLFTAGEASEAIKPLRQSIQIDPLSVNTHLALGSALEETGNRTAAEVQWRAALAIDPTSEMAMDKLSQDLMADENYSSAIELMRPVAAAGHLDVRSAINLSVAYSKSGLLDDAIDVLRATLRTHPSSVPVTEALSGVLVLQSRVTEAVALLSSAVNQHPEDKQVQIFYLRTLIIDGSGRAEPLCERLLKAHPHEWELLYLMGLLRQQAGNFIAARNLFEQSATRNPDYADTHFHLGVVLEALNDYPGAKEQLERAIARGYSDPKVHFDLGRVLKALGNESAARQQFQLYQRTELADSNETLAAAKSWQGEQAQTTGNFQQAVADYRDAVSLDPTEPLLAYRFAMALDKTGDTAGERAALQQALRDNPRMAPALNQLGYLSSDEGNTSDAIHQFQLAVQADPGYTKAWMNLAASLCMASRWTEARSALAHVLELDPSSAPAKDLQQRLNALAPQP